MVRHFARAALCIVSAAATAQAWPSKPIRMIVPYTPGGYTDNMARGLSPLAAIISAWLMPVAVCTSESKQRRPAQGPS